ncbi:MAG: SatD family protein [Pseudomonadota bacterium]
MLYVALIGDVVQSRNLANRSEVQRQFTEVCAALNQERDVLGLVSPLTITLGDEFQAVFGDAGRLWECILRIEAALEPVAIRFSIGVGKIDTDIQHDTALGMDGPAFHSARAAMEQLKKGDARYRLKGLGDDENFINAALELIAHNRVKWRTPRVVTLANILQGKTVKQISQVTGSTEQAIYRNIRDGELDAIISLLTGITEKINHVLNGQKG